jgi:3-oxoacyl-[acyl-carrier protein] reductase/(S)-1-phenylethanol dehydrogenase
MGRLDGKLAVVTGGASGIGQAFAERLAADGANVAVADIKAADATRRLVEKSGRSFFGAKCDITQPAAVDAFATELRAALGSPDILVNNAGIFPLQAFADMTFRDWRAIGAVNVDAMFLLTKAFAPAMIARGGGRIVNLTSTVNWLMIPNYVHYITTKMAVVGFTRGLANELGAHNITVNAIAPSLVRNATTEASALSTMFDVIVQQQAIHRLQVPADLAGTLAFLVSDDAAFITGQTITVDGGMTKS